MAGMAPGTRQGLIALMVARRVMAEKKRRQALAQARAKGDADKAETLRKDAETSRRSGWFRR